MSRENEEGPKPERTPASDRQSERAAPEAEEQDGSLKVHGDKYERVLDDARRTESDSE